MQLKKQQQKNIKNFLVIHEHRHGASAYLLNSKEDITGIFEDDSDDLSKKVINALAIDFENNREEFLNISEITTDNIPTL